MKLFSWNVNGVRAIEKKGFLDWFSSESPDILCIQETKAHPDQVDLKLKDYPYQGGVKSCLGMQSEKDW